MVGASYVAVMKPFLWLARNFALPVIAVLLLVWWTIAATDRNLGAEPMSWWAAVFLFGGFGIAALLPRVAIGVFYAAFLLQLIRPECRFDMDGWLAYAAIMLAAIVFAARTTGQQQRRRMFLRLIPLAVLIGLFTNLPFLGMAGEDGYPPTGLVNGKSWIGAGYGSFADFVATGQLELIVGLLVWTAAAILLLVASWMIGSTYRARALQWQAEADVSTARSALSDSRMELRITEERDRIAQDVHDITAHALSVIVAQADGLAAHADTDQTRTGLGAIAGSARSALTEIRTLLEHLEQQPDGDTAHGPEDLPALVESVRRTKTTVEYLTQGMPVPLSSAGGLAAYRITQEALTNAIRHGQAEAEPVRVLLDWRTDGLGVTITSQVAPGADTAGATGRGLVGMQQRARLAGGWLTNGIDQETASYLVTAFLPAARIQTA